MKNKINIFVQFIIVILFLSGCTIITDINKKSQLANPLETGAIHLITKAGTEYTLYNYQLKDSILYASGNYKQGFKTN